MGVEIHVAIKNTGTYALTNIVEHYGVHKIRCYYHTQPWRKDSLSPPDGSDLSTVHRIIDQGIHITKEYRTSASANSVGNSGYEG